MTRGSEEIASNEFRTAASMGTTDCCADADEWSELSSDAKPRAKKTVFFFKDSSRLLKKLAYEGVGLRCAECNFAHVFDLNWQGRLSVPCRAELFNTVLASTGCA